MKCYESIEKFFADLETFNNCDKNTHGFTNRWKMNKKINEMFQIPTGMCAEISVKCYTVMFGNVCVMVKSET